MKLSDNYQVQQLLKQHSDLSHKLYAVSNERAGFGISFNGTGEGGEALKVAAAALVAFYQGQLVAIEASLVGLGVEIDQ